MAKTKIQIAMAQAPPVNLETDWTPEQAQEAIRAAYNSRATHLQVPLTNNLGQLVVSFVTMQYVAYAIVIPASHIEQKLN